MSDLKKLQNYNKLFTSMIFVFFSSLIINILLKKGISFDCLVFTVEDIKNAMKLPVLSSFIVLSLKRIKQMAIIIVLMKLFKPEYVYNFLIVLASVVYGIIMSVQAYSGGIAYVGAFIVGIFPHYLIYFICVKLIYDFYIGRTFNKNKIKFALAVFMLTMFGVFFEENFLRFFLK